ncbi:hypothetical protein ANCCEY_02851 [Ancylostoma ceylanicum]|uniref:Oxidoreductase, short chain dehydrogenase/reductase family protein n=1 Tax=Ancylostoma ceylanicum TaxID=53326 RepID=A0A0D6M3J7_9BILA|nr:hypothetical protein ANCCEY_02851 [Ancylostoma ceylanicum]
MTFYPNGLEAKNWKEESYPRHQKGTTQNGLEYGMSRNFSRYPLDFADLQATKYGDAYLQYSRSKLMNHMTALKMARDKADGVTVNVLEPGVIETKLLKRGGYSGGPVKDGSVAPVHLATSDELKDISGEYFNNRGKKIASSADSMNKDQQDRLWKMCEEICAKFGITF